MAGGLAAAAGAAPRQGRRVLRDILVARSLPGCRVLPPVYAAHPPAAQLQRQRHSCGGTTRRRPSTDHPPASGRCVVPTPPAAHAHPRCPGRHRYSVVSPPPSSFVLSFGARQLLPTGGRWRLQWWVPLSDCCMALIARAILRTCRLARRANALSLLTFFSTPFWGAVFFFELGCTLSRRQIYISAQTPPPAACLDGRSVSGRRPEPPVYRHHKQR